MKEHKLKDLTVEDFKNIISEEIEIALAKNNQKNILTRKETIELLDISYSCLHQWINKGFITQYKLGNRSFFLYEDIMRSMLDIPNSKNSSSKSISNLNKRNVLSPNTPLSDLKMGGGLQNRLMYFTGLEITLLEFSEKYSSDDLIKIHGHNYWSKPIMSNLKNLMRSAGIHWV